MNQAPLEKKAGFIALIGRPSVGKSSLLNALTGFKTAIVSALPQTTRTGIRGIYTDERGQIVFSDTPGLHQSQRKFNQYMEQQAKNALQAADAALYLADASRAPGDEEAAAARLLQQAAKPVIVALNKMDKKTLFLDQYRRFFQAFFPDAVLYPISAAAGQGLDKLKQALFDALPQGPALYPEDVYTDQEPAFRIAEIIREQAMACLREEAPHSVYVEIADLEMKGAKLWARAFIMVERESQQGMLVGKGGQTIKKIRIGTLKELRPLFPYKIELDLKIKTDKNWRKNDKRLKKMYGISH